MASFQPAQPHGEREPTIVVSIHAADIENVLSCHQALPTISSNGTIHPNVLALQN